MKIMFSSYFLLGFILNGFHAQADFLEAKTAYEKSDFATAYAEFLPLAKEGDAASQFFVAIIYYNGFGRDADSEKGLKWLRLSAKQNFAPAQAQLGLRLSLAPKDTDDYHEAIKLIRLAAAKDNHNAQHTLGKLYLKGLDGPPDLILAHMWFNLSATSGNVYASQEREKLNKSLSVKDLLKAQDMALEWAGKHQ